MIASWVNKSTSTCAHCMDCERHEVQSQYGRDSNQQPRSMVRHYTTGGSLHLVIEGAALLYKVSKPHLPILPTDSGVM